MGAITEEEKEGSKREGNGKETDKKSVRKVAGWFK